VVIREVGVWMWGRRVGIRRRERDVDVGRKGRREGEGNGEMRGE